MGREGRAGIQEELKPQGKGPGLSLQDPGHYRRRGIDLS